MADEGARAALDQNVLRNTMLGPGSAWRRIDVVTATGSTNADLIGRAGAGEDIGGAILLAEDQTAGRGRNGRTWSAVPGAQISMSVGVSTAGLPAAAWGWVPLATGIAVVAAIADVTGVQAGLKWPNDVLSRPDGHKLAGILAEVATPASAIVVGIGVNVSLGSDELPEPTATSLALLGARQLDRTAIAAAILRRLQEQFDALRAAGGADDAMVAQYTAKSLTIGTRVRAMLPGDRQVVGDALAIDGQGRLRIQTEQDEVVVSAGDIVHLRPV